MGHNCAKDFEPLNICILTVSDTRTLEQDTSGDYLQQAILQAGHNLEARDLLTDNLYDIRAKVSQWIADSKCQVVIITGGTGFYAKDITPEAITPLFDKSIDGFGEVFRQVSQKSVGLSTLQSRAVGGISNKTLIFGIPGSTGACKDAWQGILLNQLDARTSPCNFVPHVR